MTEEELLLASLRTRLPVSVSQTNSPPPPPPEAAAACFASGPSAAEHHTLVTTKSGSVIAGHGEEEEEEGSDDGLLEEELIVVIVFGRSDRASLTLSAESRPQVSSVAPSTLHETLVICAAWRCLTSETHFPDRGSLFC